MSAPSPLAGTRVIDLTMGWAGPLLTRHMADLGADVLKIEDETKFDWWRGASHTAEDIAAGRHEVTTNYLFVNRNKRGLSIDLTRPEGHDIVLALVAGADVVVENQATGVMDKLGLDWDSLRAANPGLIFLSLPGFGAEGPWSAFRGYGSTFEQCAGLPHLSGGPGDPPVQLHIAYGDPVGGLTALSALLVALWHKRWTGEGQRVELSQVEAILQLGFHGPVTQSVTGAPPERTGNRHLHLAPQGCYACAGDDAWIVLTVTDDRHWPALARLVGRADLAGDPGLAGAEGRRARADEIDAAIAAWCAARGAAEAQALLSGAGIAAAEAVRADGPVNDDVLTARGYWAMADRAVTGPMRVPAAPYAIDGARPEIRHAAPWLGQHTAEVLRDLLQMPEDRIDALRTQGVIGPGTVGPRG